MIGILWQSKFLVPEVGSAGNMKFSRIGKPNPDQAVSSLACFILAVGMIGKPRRMKYTSGFLYGRLGGWFLRE